MENTLRDLRKENKKNCAELAQVLGVEKSTYYNYEQGTRRINLEQVLSLAQFYEISEKEIIQAQLNSCRSFR